MSSAASLLRFRNEKVGLRGFSKGDGNSGGEDGGDERSEPEEKAPGEDLVFFAAGGLESTVDEEALSWLATPLMVTP